MFFNLNNKELISVAAASEIVLLQTLGGLVCYLANQEVCASNHRGTRFFLTKPCSSRMKTPILLARLL